MSRPQPGVWNRIVAANRGEVSAELLEAYRRAGATLHEQLDAIEKIRFDRKLEGRSPWDAPMGEQTELVCTWNAYALQTLGDAFLDADYEAHPVTAGFVPRVTYDQVMDLYSGVEGWLGRARQASANSGYRLDVPLPAPLPRWSEVEPCPRPHLDGIMKAVSQLRLHFEHALHIFEGEGTSERFRPQLEHVRGLFAEARSKADYIGAMYTPNATPELHERIEQQAKVVMELLYKAGQLVAMPSLVDQDRGQGRPNTPPARPGIPVRPPPPKLPGDPGFDLWQMTDEDAYRANSRDNGATRAIQDMWKYDPDPKRSLELWSEIEMAVRWGDAEIARDPRTGAKIGNFACTPYASIWRALKPLTIGDTHINTLQTFTLEVACEGVLVGRAFKRNVVVGNFQPATLEYCDPRIPEDDH